MHLPRPVVAAALSIVLAIPLSARSAEPAPEPGRAQARVDRAVKVALDHFDAQKLKADEVAVTLLDLTQPGRVDRGEHRGGELIYPASVIKLFYLVATQRALEDGRLADTEELRRAMRDMIVDSSNDATSYLVDLLTGTTSGPELPDDELRAWSEKRNAVNRYFASLGEPAFAGINVNKKPWGDGPYGRETQAMRAFEPKRNALSTNAVATLLHWIVDGKAVSAARCAQMKQLLSRDPSAKSDDPDHQSKFIGAVLPPGARLWSKAGWTSTTRHDAAYVELPNGAKFILVIFTVNHAQEPEILHTIAGSIVDELK